MSNIFFITPTNLKKNQIFKSDLRRLGSYFNNYFRELNSYNSLLVSPETEKYSRTIEIIQKNIIKNGNL